MKYKTLLAAGLFVTSLCLCSTAGAGEAGDAVRASLGKLTGVPGDSPEFPALVDGLVDHGVLAARVFEGLDGGSSAERAEARVLLVDVVRVVMRRHATRLKAATVKWGTEMTEGGARVVVRSTVKSGDDVVEVAWVVVRGKAGWRLVDVVTEGVSMVSTWKRQIAAAHSRGGWSSVLKKLRRAGEAGDAR